MVLLRRELRHSLWPCGRSGGNRAFKASTLDAGTNLMDGLNQKIDHVVAQGTAAQAGASAAR